MNRQFDSIMMSTMLGPLVALTQLFALYVLIHGHYSPGGGFQGGVLMAAAMILPLLIYRKDEQPAGVVVVGPKGAITMTAIGVLIFVGVGLVSMLYGNPPMNYADLPLPTDDATRRTLGILGIEIGVQLGVTGGVLSIFHSLYTDLPQEADQ